MDRAEYAYQFFISKGFRPHHAAAIVGNLMEESSSKLDTRAFNSKENAHGIAQWRFERWDNLKNRYDDPHDFDNQLDYVWHELNTTHKHALDRILATTDANSASNAVMNHYEVAAPVSGPNRIKNTNKILSNFSGNSPQGNMGGSGSGGGARSTGGGGGPASSISGEEKRVIEGRKKDYLDIVNKYDSTDNRAIQARGLYRSAINDSGLSNKDKDLYLIQTDDEVFKIESPNYSDTQRSVYENELSKRKYDHNKRYGGNLSIPKKYQEERDKLESMYDLNYSAADRQKSDFAEKVTKDYNDTREKINNNSNLSSQERIEHIDRLNRAYYNENLHKIVNDQNNKLIDQENESRIERYPNNLSDLNSLDKIYKGGFTPERFSKEFIGILGHHSDPDRHISHRQELMNEDDREELNSFYENNDSDDILIVSPQYLNRSDKRNFEDFFKRYGEDVGIEAKFRGGSNYYLLKKSKVDDIARDLSSDMLTSGGWNPSSGLTQNRSFRSQNSPLEHNRTIDVNPLWDLEGDTGSDQSDYGLIEYEDAIGSDVPSPSPTTVTYPDDPQTIVERIESEPIDDGTDLSDVSTLLESINNPDDSLHFDYDAGNYSNEYPIESLLANSVNAIMGANLANTDLPERDDTVSDAVLRYVEELKIISEQGLSPQEESARKKLLNESYQSSLDSYIRSSNGNRNLVLANLGALDSAKMTQLMQMSLEDEAKKLEGFYKYGEAMQGLDQMRRQKELDDYNLQMSQAEARISQGSELFGNAMSSMINSIQDAKDNGPGSWQHMLESYYKYTLTKVDPNIKNQDDANIKGSAAHREAQHIENTRKYAEAQEALSLLPNLTGEKAKALNALAERGIPVSEYYQSIKALEGYELADGAVLRDDIDVKTFRESGNPSSLFTLGTRSIESDMFNDSRNRSRLNEYSFNQEEEQGLFNDNNTPGSNELTQMMSDFMKEAAPQVFSNEEIELSGLFSDNVTGANKPHNNISMNEFVEENPSKVLSKLSTDKTSELVERSNKMKKEVDYFSSLTDIVIQENNALIEEDKLGEEDREKQLEEIKKVI